MILYRLRLKFWQSIETNISEFCSKRRRILYKKAYKESREEWLKRVVSADEAD